MNPATCGSCMKYHHVEPSSIRSLWGRCLGQLFVVTLMFVASIAAGCLGERQEVGPHPQFTYVGLDKVNGALTFGATAEIRYTYENTGDLTSVAVVEVKGDGLCVANTDWPEDTGFYEHTVPPADAINGTVRLNVNPLGDKGHQLICTQEPVKVNVILRDVNGKIFDYRTLPVSIDLGDSSVKPVVYVVVEGGAP